MDEEQATRQEQDIEAEETDKKRPWYMKLFGGLWNAVKMVFITVLLGRKEAARRIQQSETKDGKNNNKNNKDKSEQQEQNGKTDKEKLKNTEQNKESIKIDPVKGPKENIREDKSKETFIPQLKPKSVFKAQFLNMTDKFKQEFIARLSKVYDINAEDITVENLKDENGENVIAVGLCGREIRLGEDGSGLYADQMKAYETLLYTANEYDASQDQDFLKDPNNSEVNLKKKGTRIDPAVLWNIYREVEESYDSLRNDGPSGYNECKFNHLGISLTFGIDNKNEQNGKDHDGIIIGIDGELFSVPRDLNEEDKKTVIKSIQEIAQEHLDKRQQAYEQSFNNELTEKGLPGNVIEAQRQSLTRDYRDGLKKYLSLIYNKDENNIDIQSKDGVLSIDIKGRMGKTDHVEITDTGISLNGKNGFNQESELLKYHLKQYTDKIWNMETDQEFTGNPNNKYVQTGLNGIAQTDKAVRTAVKKAFEKGSLDPGDKNTWETINGYGLKLVYHEDKDNKPAYLTAYINQEPALKPDGHRVIIHGNEPHCGILTDILNKPPKDLDKVAAAYKADIKRCENNIIQKQQAKAMTYMEKNAGELEDCILKNIEGYIKNEINKADTKNLAADIAQDYQIKAGVMTEKIVSDTRNALKKTQIDAKEMAGQYQHDYSSDHKNLLNAAQEYVQEYRYDEKAIKKMCQAYANQVVKDNITEYARQCVSDSLISSAKDMYAAQQNKGFHKEFDNSVESIVIATIKDNALSAAQLDGEKLAKDFMERHDGGNHSFLDNGARDAADSLRAVGISNKEPHIENAIIKAAEHKSNEIIAAKISGTLQNMQLAQDDDIKKIINDTQELTIQNLAKDFNEKDYTNVIDKRIRETAKDMMQEIDMQAETDKVLGDMDQVLEFAQEIEASREIDYSSFDPANNVSEVTPLDGKSCELEPDGYEEPDYEQEQEEDYDL